MELTDIARRFNVGYEEIVRANPGVDPWLPGEGREIVIPSQFILPNAPREGIVINAAAMPSPVETKSEQMMWPDCSPPRVQPRRLISSIT